MFQKKKGKEKKKEKKNILMREGFEPSLKKKKSYHVNIIT